MKKCLTILLSMVVICFISNLLNAQWVQTNGPEGGEAKCFTSIDTILFVGTEIGVFRSTNDGASWTSTGPEINNILSLAVSPAGGSGMNLFAGTLGGGVWLSTDNGNSWNPVNFGLGNRYITALAVIDTNLFAGTDSSGVYFSPSNGAYWIPVSTGLTNTSIRSLTAIGTNLYAGTDGGLFVSTDHGTSWTPIGLAGEIVNAFAVIDTNLFAGTDTSGVFRSTDNGTNWKIISIPDMDRCVRALAVINTDLFVGTHQGIYLTPANGAYWIPVNTGLTNKIVEALYVNGTDIFAGTYSGVYRSTNNGANWTQVNSGLKTTVVNALAASGESLFAGSRGDLYRSDDRGDSWISCGIGGWITSIAVSGTNVYLGHGGQVVYSLNNGTSWDFLHLPEKVGWISSLAIIDPYVFAGSDSAGVYRIIRDVHGWRTFLNFGQPDTVVNCLAVSGTNLFAGTSNGIYLSSSNGDNWTSVNNGLTNLDVTALAVKGSNLFAGTRNGGVFLSTNNGASWTPVNTGLTDPDILSFAVSGDNLFAGTWQGGVFLSTNDGASWAEVNTGLMYSVLQASSVVHSLAVVGTDLYAGTRGAMVWRRPISEMITSVEIVSSDLPLTFSLHQNYPNPFNPSTTVRYDLPERARVLLEVCNITGQKVASLVNEVQDAKYYEITFDASHLPSGLYIYRLQAGEYVGSKKMLFIK
jgi:ligand-binding sensor domain-containing protein